MLKAAAANCGWMPLLTFSVPDRAPEIIIFTAVERAGPVSTTAKCVIAEVDPVQAGNWIRSALVNGFPAPVHLVGLVSGTISLDV